MSEIFTPVTAPQPRLTKPIQMSKVSTPQPMLTLWLKKPQTGGYRGTIDACHGRDCLWKVSFQHVLLIADTLLLFFVLVSSLLFSKQLNCQRFHSLLVTPSNHLLFSWNKHHLTHRTLFTLDISHKLASCCSSVQICIIFETPNTVPETHDISLNSTPNTKRLVSR